VGQNELPSFDLVVATVDRIDELGRLLDSLESQTHRAFRVLVVDQNEDERLDPILTRHNSLAIRRLRSARGLSRARNVGLAEVCAELVAFPDDDCVFAPDLLEQVAQRLQQQTQLDGVTGRAADADGHSSSSWARDRTLLTRANLWNRAISFTIFLRTDLVRRVGGFDEQLGLGSEQPWSSGEETDFLVRSVDAGGRIEYDPSLTVVHPDKKLSRSALQAVGAREGASIGYILRKHRYPLPTVGRMLLRPLGGAALALARLDGTRAHFHLSTLRGRVLGYRS
jgi:GT2 family glycosyltransferase